MAHAVSTSNSSFIVDVGEAYPYPSHVSTPNIVTMKLSGKDTYNVWETQILCLLMSHRMFGFVEGQFPSPAEHGKGKEGDLDAWIASDSLVKGWILGSLSDGVAKKVVNRLKLIHKKTAYTAKDLWDELQRSYGTSDREQAAEIKAESAIEVVSVYEEATSKDGPKKLENLRKGYYKKRLYDYILRGDKGSVRGYLEEAGLKPWDKLTNNGNTIKTERE